MSVENSAPRRRGRAPRATGVALPERLPRLHVPWAPLDLFTAEQVELVVDAAWAILARGGLEIRSARARDIYRRGGAVVDDATQMVRIPREVGEAHLKHAPARFVIHARNPERDLHVGGDVVNFGPVNGAPHVSDSDQGRRYGDIAAFRDILKVTHALGVLHWQGGVVVEPVDVPVPLRHLHMYQAHIELSDIPWAARGVGGVAAADAIEMSCLEHGVSRDELARTPRLLVVTNVNSPRRVDEEILDGIMLLAEAGQCVVITPFTLMGAMAPVTLAGALAQQTAEALGIIALVQMIRPGCPAVMGGFTSNVDMKTGSPAFGTPEYLQATLGGAQLARRLGVPYRSSVVNASPVPDGQAMWETAASLWASVMSHSHLANHAAGWLEGGLSASMEKIVLDSELLRAWAAVMRPVEVSPASLAVDDILAVPPGGHFFGEAHTLARYETAFWRPFVSDWSNFENWRDAGGRTATERAAVLWKQVRDAYEPPPLDDGAREAVAEFVARRTRELT